MTTKGRAVSKAAETYLCTPFQFPLIAGGVPSNNVSSPVLQPVRDQIVDFAKSIPESYQQFQGMVQQLWSVVERAIPGYPQKAATGEETLHPG